MFLINLRVEMIAVCICAYMITFSFEANAIEKQSSYNLDKDGYIHDWLIIGPYPNYKKEKGGKGFAEKHRGEANIIPYLGLKNQAVFIADEAKLIANIGSSQARCQFIKNKYVK